jgi:methyltransferase (TIGR00027 family)
MDPQQASTSTQIAAFLRAHHANHDGPKIFDDKQAIQLFTELERDLVSRTLAEALKFFDPQRAAECPDAPSALAALTHVQSGPIVLTRARYTEDALAAAVGQGVKQHVILGAGMDTFAFRRPDRLRQLQVFEIDHPGTQDFKRRRLAGSNLLMSGTGPCSVTAHRAGNVNYNAAPDVPVTTTVGLSLFLPLVLR